MGLGVLEDRVMAHVPGTTRYFDDPERPQYAADGAEGLKCDTNGSVPIILVPQPSDDPNDPLNWPLWKRDLITFMLSMSAIFATCLAPILAANTLTLTFDLTIPFTKVAALTAWYLLGVGVGAFFFVPTGRVWGKRHLFIAGMAALVATSAWAGASRKNYSSTSKNYTSLVWARVCQGIATAPFESLVIAAVGDLYCVHQRGIRMAFSNLAVFGGAFFTPIVVGKITHSIGWRWTFNLVAIFCGVCLLVLFFFCPETAYRRNRALDLDLLDRENPAMKPSDVAAHDLEKSLANDGPSAPERPNGGTSQSEESRRPVDKDRFTDALAPVSGRLAVPRKATYVQSLALFNGRKTDDKFWKLLLRPLPLFLQPAFLWACLIQGLLIGWTVFIGVILAQFFLSTPLWWTEVQTGYAYTAAFIGAVVGFIVAGALSDWSARFLTKLNGGIYEPEFRIVLVIPQMIFGCVGLYGWGRTVDGLLYDKYPYTVPLAFFAFEVAGMVIGAVASSLYIVDAYRDLVIEGFTCMIVFKNIFSYGLTLRAFDWLIENQTRATHLFNIIASVQLCVCLLSIPMYVFGKRVRSFFHRHDLLAMFKVR